ncbi:SPRY domain-containing protein [Paenibacillus turicensis]|uniref:SPRY domain-containing protein n=1 Tax=Paenibacillus turicensis TaxID=160487 RepID=UPI003D2B4440
MEINPVTLNPSDMGSSIVLSNENLTMTISSSTAVRATHGKTYGKWYWEVKLDSGHASIFIGVSNKTENITFLVGSTNWRSYYGGSGKKYPENVSFNNAWAVGNIIGVALDLDNGTLEFYKNGVSMGVSHTNVKELGEVYPTFRGDSGNTTRLTANFGATPFTYNMPSGFKAYTMYPSHKILISYGDEHYSIIPEVYATETAVPQMTSNTTPSGRAFSSSVYNTTNYDAWRAFNRFDDYEGFVSANGSGGIGYLGYEFEKQIMIFKYIVRSGAHTTYLHELPKDWTFEGSNDGVNWDVLDTQTSKSWTAINTDKEYIIDISKIDNYKMYRLNWTANNGANFTAVNELKMFEYTPPKLSALPNQSEQNFINYGMKKDSSIDLTTSKILERRYIVQDNVELGSGKVFKQRIDISKIPIRSAVIE